MFCTLVVRGAATTTHRRDEPTPWPQPWQRHGRPRGKPSGYGWHPATQEHLQRHLVKLEAGHD